MDFRDNAFEANWYPRRRGGRTGTPSTLEAPAPAAVPRMRVFPWVFAETANSRRSFSLPRIVGPAIIKDVSFYCGTLLTPANKSLEIGYADQPVSEAGVALATVRPYTVLTELQDPFAQISDLAGQGLIVGSPPQTQTRFAFQLDLIVNLPEFFPIIALANNSLNAQEWTGHMRVLENVDPDALRFFL